MFRKILIKLLVVILSEFEQINFYSAWNYQENLGISPMEIWILATIPSRPKFIEEAYMKDFLCKNFVKLPWREYLTENALKTVMFTKLGKYETKVSCLFDITEKPHV